MSGFENGRAPEPAKPSLFDERPGVDDGEKTSEAPPVAVDTVMAGLGDEQPDPNHVPSVEDGSV